MVKIHISKKNDTSAQTYRFLRAASGTRTHDLFVTNEMLYQLSYCGLIYGAKVMNFDGKNETPPRI